MSNKIIGIDLGSTNSAVSIIENGKPTIVVNEEGSRTTPSVILLKNGDRKVGSSAKRQQIVNPKETVSLIKRFMGATYDECDEARKHVKYDVVNRDGFPKVSIDGREYSPEELSSMIIQKMKTIAEDYCGTSITRAVITVPAFFNDAARQATKTAGELAGLTVERIIAEPTAAILASNIDMKKGGKFMVTDFGGATLDNSVADIDDSLVEILATNGDIYCGGSDIDKLIADTIVEDFKNNHGIDLSTDAQAYARIYEASENAKCELSTSMTTDINLPYIAVGEDKTPIHLNFTLTRARFEKMITPIIDKVINCGKAALKDAGLKASDLDGILLVGGSCRIPYVQDRLVKEFGVELIKSANLDECVSMGAAVQGGIIAGETNADVILLDVTPLRYGIETLGGVMTTLVDANTTIPVKKSQVFSTAQDNQPAVTIRILQGMRPMAKDNKEIAQFNLDGIMPAPKGMPQIEVTFEIDVNGILSVSAIDKGTNKEQHITIETKTGLTDADIERIKAEAEAHAEEDKKAKEHAEKVNTCESNIWQTERQLDELKDNAALTDEDKTYFNEKIEVLREMQKNDDYEKLDDVIKEMTERWHSVSARGYQYAQAAGGDNPNMADMFKQNFGGSQPGTESQPEDVH